MCADQAVELRKAAVASVDACEVDTVEMAQRLARLRREIGMVRGTPGRIEAHLSCFAARVDEAGEEAGTVDADLASREVARDRGEAVLFAHALLVAREAERREGADDEEDNRNRPHRQKIDTRPGGIEKRLCGSEPLVADPAIRDKAKRAIRHRTARSKGSCPMFYPTGGCVPQSGEFEPGACVTCVKPVPSTLTV